MKKRSIFLAACLALSFGCLTACDGEEASGFTYQKAESGESYILTGFKGNMGTEITIPNEYKGLPVTEIGKEAFYYTKNSDLASVTFEADSPLTTIGYSAFSGCAELTSITLPSGLTTIGVYAFSSSGLTSVTIPDRATLPSLHPQNNYCTL